MDRPRRAMLEEPDADPEEPVPYVARRSGGFAPADPDDTPIRPVRGSRARVAESEIEAEPEADVEGQTTRPRRAMLDSSDPETPTSLPPVTIETSRGVETTEEWRRRVASFFPAPPAQPRQSMQEPAPNLQLEPEPVAQSDPRPEPEPVAQSAPSPPSDVQESAVTQTSPAPRSDTPSFVPSRPSVSVEPTPSREPASTSALPRVEPIVVDRLVKSYNGKLAVRNLSFTVQPGRVTGFLGPNGAGKTTTMRILVGLITATTGTATFGSIPYAGLARPQRSVGCVLDANFHPGRTGRNHLRILAPTAGAGDDRVDDLLDLVGLSDAARQPAGEYSLGMRQRLALAAALLGDPEYLILDEPANGLDPEGIRWLRSLLRDFAQAGRAVLVSSHLLNEVQATADDIVVINKGRLLTQMPIAELNLGEGTTRARVADLDAARRALSTIAAQVEVGSDDQGQYLRVHSDEVATVGAALFGAGVVVHELVTERRDLEQEFFAMLEEST